jgi:hypothetical protein
LFQAGLDIISGVCRSRSRRPDVNDRPKEIGMFLVGLFVGMFIGANVGVVIAGMLMRAKLEQRITRCQAVGPVKSRRHGEPALSKSPRPIV